MTASAPLIASRLQPVATAAGSFVTVTSPQGNRTGVDRSEVQRSRAWHGRSHARNDPLVQGVGRVTRGPVQGVERRGQSPAEHLDQRPVRAWLRPGSQGAGWPLRVVLAFGAKAGQLRRCTLPARFPKSGPIRSRPVNRMPAMASNSSTIKAGAAAPRQ